MDGLPKSTISRIMKAHTDLQVSEQAVREMERCLVQMIGMVTKHANLSAKKRRGANKRLVLGDMIVGRVNAISELYHE